MSELNEIVIRQLERLYYWDEIENILVLIVENRVGIDLADRKQYARDIISFGKSEEWFTISDYLISVLSRCGLAENYLFSMINTSSRSIVPELANIVQYTASAKLNGYQSQEVNMELTKSLVRRDEAIYIALIKAQIEYSAYKAKHDEDETKITLLYQIIGAILSDVALKNIFVFQGVSNGGKSTLAHIIMRLLNDYDVKFIGSMNEINTTKCSPYDGRIKLLYVDDAPNEKWNDSTVSYLKTRSREIMKKGETLFKILLCTNYPIYYKTEDGRDESMDSRIVVLPFEKDLNSATIDNSEVKGLVDYIHSEKFEEEKVHIAVKSLYYFREVLNNNCEFIYRYPINSYVISSKVNTNIFNDKNDDVIIDVADYTIINTSKNISEKNSKLIEWLRENFEITENEYLMAEQVFDYIREVMPETHGRIHDVGKVVRSVFGDKVDFRRN